MMALEEKNFQSIKTDASLYNGLPTDTGTMCYSAEVTSSTPPSRNARMGGGGRERAYRKQAMVCPSCFLW